ncbi:hypothetical protein [Chlorogloeopsis sp. ULAP01]|uniref:hypothetical protein n=1 Tax=Chlorogloeopsis sp. ULAP01 TaxID=3056483 RepID=UPI0025AC3CEA|nr:hypothetical protein [Chlorogloeopsis sp. ULAP01]
MKKVSGSTLSTKNWRVEVDAPQNTRHGEMGTELLITVREAARPCGASAVVSQRALAALPTCSDWRRHEVDKRK